MRKLLLWVFRNVMHLITSFYYYTRMMHIMSNTNRYCELRPSDAILFQVFIVVFILIGIPIVSIMWLLGVMSDYRMIVCGAVLIALPPLLTMTLCECWLWSLRRKQG